MSRQDTVGELISAAERMIRAAGRRAGECDPEDLRRLMAVQQVLDTAVTAAVVGIRRDHTWQSIGDALGVTKEACVLRWGKVAREAGAKGPRTRA